MVHRPNGTKTKMSSNTHNTTLLLLKVWQIVHIDTHTYEKNLIPVQ